MSTNDTDRDLIVVLSYLAGRQLKTAEVFAALGMSRSTYYERRDNGTLTTVPNLLAAAEAFDLSKIDLLVRYGHLCQRELVDYLESEGALEAEVEPGTDAHPPQPTGGGRMPRRRLRARLDVPSF